MNKYENFSDAPSLKQVPVGYFRFYTYQPILPVASSRSYVPSYQNGPRYINEVVNWGPRGSSIPQHNGELLSQVPPPSKIQQSAAAAAISHQNVNHIKPIQAPIPTTNAPIEEVSVTKSIPSTTTTTTTTAASLTSPTINDIPVNHIEISETLSSTGFTRDNQINSIAPAVHNIPLAQYSQPIGDPNYLPPQYQPNYQNPQVQYMPCMCPVTVGFGGPELLGNKPIESREDGFDVQVPDFE